MPHVRFTWWRGTPAIKDGEIVLFAPEPYELPLGQTGQEPAYLEFAQIRPGDVLAVLRFVARWGLLGAERVGRERYVGYDGFGWETLTLEEPPSNGHPVVMFRGWTPIVGVEKLDHWWAEAQQMDRIVQALMTLAPSASNRREEALAVVEERLWPARLRLEKARSGGWLVVSEPMTLLQALYVQVLADLQEAKQVARCQNASCGTWFVLDDPRQQYCSKHCRWAAQKRAQRQRARAAKVGGRNG